MTARALVAVALGWSAAAQAGPAIGLELRAGGSASLTPGRTQGGLGAGAGVRLVFDERWLVHADVAALFALGVVGLVRAGAGWQRPGTWSPMVRADVELGFGGSLDFSIGGRAPPHGPTLGLVASAGLLRFVTGKVTISVLELGIGVSTDFQSVGPRFGLSLLELGIAL